MGDLRAPAYNPTSGRRDDTADNDRHPAAVIENVQSGLAPPARSLRARLMELAIVRCLHRNVRQVLTTRPGFPAQTQSGSTDDPKQYR